MPINGLFLKLNNITHHILYRGSIFICSKVFSNLNFTNLIIFLIFIIIFFVILGFPKTVNSNIDTYLEEKIEISPVCEVISLFSENTNFTDCQDRLKKTCDYNIYSNDAQNILDSQKINLSINEKNPILFLSNENKTIKVTNYKECENLLMKGARLYKPLPTTLRPLPLINMIYFIITIFYIVYFLFINLYKNSNKKVKN